MVILPPGFIGLRAEKLNDIIDRIFNTNVHEWS